jgi:hypothetical protein
MHFDLQQMISQHNLKKIETPFSNKDIDNIVKSMPPDKAPRPDGFNGCLLKNVGISLKRTSICCAGSSSREKLAYRPLTTPSSP